MASRITRRRAQRCARNARAFEAFVALYSCDQRQLEPRSKRRRVEPIPVVSGGGSSAAPRAAGAFCRGEVPMYRKVVSPTVAADFRRIHGRSPPRAFPRDCRDRGPGRRLSCLSSLQPWSLRSGRRTAPAPRSCSEVLSGSCSELAARAPAYPRRAPTPRMALARCRVIPPCGTWSSRGDTEGARPVKAAVTRGGRHVCGIRQAGVTRAGTT
jgi:hypothetical protein